MIPLVEHTKWRATEKDVSYSRSFTLLLAIAVSPGRLHYKLESTQVWSSSELIYNDFSISWIFGTFSQRRIGSTHQIQHFGAKNFR